MENLEGKVISGKVLKSGTRDLTLATPALVSARSRLPGATFIGIAREACGNTCRLVSGDNSVCVRVHTCVCVCVKRGKASAVQKHPPGRLEVCILKTLTVSNDRSHPVK